MSHHKYAGQLDPRWLWGVRKQLSQTIEEIHDVDTVAVVKKSTVQCRGGGCAGGGAEPITHNQSQLIASTNKPVNIPAQWHSCHII